MLSHAGIAPWVALAPLAVSGPQIFTSVAAPLLMVASLTGAVCSNGRSSGWWEEVACEAFVPWLRVGCSLSCCLLDGGGL